MKKELILSGHSFQPVYTSSYILRIWREDASQRTGWRISLEDPLTSERIGFTSFEKLHKFLLELTEKSQI